MLKFCWDWRHPKIILQLEEDMDIAEKIGELIVKI